MSENEISKSSNASPVSPASPNYKPIGMWGYFGYELLFSIPIIGFIFLLVFSFGGTKNINLRNFARSFFCMFILVVVLLVIIFIITLLSGGSLAFSYYL